MYHHQVLFNKSCSLCAQTTKHQQIVRSVSLSNKSVWYIYNLCTLIMKLVMYEICKTTLMTHNPAIRGVKNNNAPAFWPSGWLLCSDLIGYTFSRIVSSPKIKHVGWKAKDPHTFETKNRSHYLQITIFWDHWTWTKNTTCLQKKIGVYRL